MSYFQWLFDDNNSLYCFFTFFLISAFTFVIVHIVIFIIEVIDKFRTIDKLSSRVEKLEKRKNK